MAINIRFIQRSDEVLSFDEGNNSLSTRNGNKPFSTYIRTH